VRVSSRLHKSATKTARLHPDGDSWSMSGK
jgi:hypothetical protein